MFRIFSSVLLALLACAGPAEARTWYVTVEGTGDAPTIAAAIDSAAVGDTVLVGPGTYTIDVGLVLKPQMVLVSEGGPLSTRLNALPMSVAFTVSNRAGSEINGFWVQSGTAAAIGSWDDCLIQNNIVKGIFSNISITHPCEVRNNLLLELSAVYFGNADAVFSHNIVLSGVICGQAPIAVCNNFVEGVECTGYLPDANFSSDPLFCGEAGSGNYFLRSNSPCAPGNTPLPGDCGLIGPLPVGCGPVSVDEKSWGAVKSLYR